MPIALPPIHIGGIELPPEPAEPPTPMDVYCAWNFCQHVEDRNRRFSIATTAQDIASPEDVSHARIYLHQVLHAAATGGPAGMADLQPLIVQAVQQLNNINQQLNQHMLATDQRFNQIDHRLNQIEGRQLEMFEVLCQAYNQGCRDGTQRPYKTIPFRLPDGGTELPETVGLPALQDARSIETLLDADLNTYLLRYNIPHAGNLNRATKVGRLKAFLGCTRQPW
ncbi:hypothetical protein EDD15DRAFT_2254299 [Pisolithus albus]|nr:hypothetical protein EDD15DRAFT_2254299 [Pisolithus albus]